jgi:thiol-disulfide isomerase/thioredoxin
MNGKIKIVIGAGLFALGLGVCYFTYNNLLEQDILPGASALADPVATTAPAEDSGYVPMAAPNFTLQDIAGNSLEFDDLKGRPLVLNFWASWCPPCIIEMPEYNKVYQELGEQVTFVMVDLVNDRESVADGKAHVEKNNFTFPVYFDVNEDGAATYQINSIPTTFFINAEGFIETGVVGGIDEATLKKGIGYILK